MVTNGYNIQLKMISVSLSLSTFFFILVALIFYLIRRLAYTTWYFILFFPVTNWIIQTLHGNKYTLSQVWHTKSVWAYCNTKQEFNWVSEIKHIQMWYTHTQDTHTHTHKTITNTQISQGGEEMNTFFVNKITVYTIIIVLQKHLPL